MVKENNVLLLRAAGWAPADASADAGTGCDSATNAAAALDQGRGRDRHERPSGLRAIVSAPRPQRVSQPPQVGDGGGVLR